MQFRTLQTDTLGTLYLHSMPGRFESLKECIFEIHNNAISQIICLTPDKEIAEKSPDYATAITEKRIPVERVCFPVLDYTIPENVDAFYALAREVAGRLNSGENLLVHCAGGSGRTGMFAGCVLKALGKSTDALGKSGCFPLAEQEKVIQNFS